jgi:DNA modification methylase
MAILRRVTERVVHRSNRLNRLTGEEWLYFTKSLWTTAYPSELGHAARRAHGANKPPRLMARLIEFFTVPGELVLDPFAGVGGTLLGAAIAHEPRRALGIELEPRWLDVYRSVVQDLLAERDGLGPELADLGPSDPGGPRRFDPAGVELRLGDALTLLPTLPAGSVDFVATDPPYNPQLRLTMAGGPLSAEHATDARITRWSRTTLRMWRTATATGRTLSAWSRRSASCAACSGMGGT